MRTLWRGVIGLLGLFNIVVGLGFLLAPAKLAEAFFLAPVGSQGMATLRADFPGFFIGAAVFALVGAWTGKARWLLVPMLMLGIAFSGRVFSLVADGMAATALAPMLVEATMLVLLLFAWRNFEKV